MSIFDTSSVEAGHRRLASSLYQYTAALEATGVLVDAALLRQNFVRSDPQGQVRFLALSQLGFRLVNDIGAAIKLLEAGYFVQSAAFGRDMAEIGMLAIHFAGSPDDLLKWARLEGKHRYRSFGRSQLKSTVAPEDFTYFNDRFDFFSEFGTHPSFQSIAAHMDGEQLHVGPHINQSLFQNTYRELATLAWRAADVGGLVYKAVFDLSVAELLPNEFASFMRHGDVLRNLEIKDSQEETFTKSVVDDDFIVDNPTSPHAGEDGKSKA